MNKDLIIRKIAFITEEMQQQTQEWLNKGNNVSSLEIDAFLSNIRYLIEQSEILNNFLIEEKEGQPEVRDIHKATETIVQETEEVVTSTPKEETLSVVEGEQDIVETHIKVERESIEMNRTQVQSSEGINKPLNEQLKTEQESLLERLKKNIEDKTIAERLKTNTLKKDLNFSLNDRFFMINQLFDGNTSHFSEVIYKISEYNDWTSVENFLENEIAAQFQWQEREDVKQKFYEMLRVRFSE